MADSSAVNVGSVPVLSLGKGRVPTVESLEKKISRIEKIIARAARLKALLPDLNRKLAIVSDPAFASRSEAEKAVSLERKASKVETLLKSLPPEMVAQILASLGK